MIEGENIRVQDLPRSLAAFWIGAGLVRSYEFGIWLCLASEHVSDEGFVTWHVLRAGTRTYPRPRLPEFDSLRLRRQRLQNPPRNL